MTTKTVDGWCAAQCGVVIYPDHWVYGEKYYKGPWSIKKTDCREILREHFRIATEPYDDDDYRASTYIEGPESSDVFIYADSKTIAEAEITAITAIYEASQ